MQLWDEIIRNNANIIVLAATNRASDLDPAILRRFERSYLVPTPDFEARRDILSKYLSDIPLEQNFDFSLCASLSEGYSPSDLHSVCKCAVGNLVQDVIQEESSTSDSEIVLRTEVK